MNNNPGIQMQATTAWTGAAAVLGDITKHVNFGWQFEVTAPITVDAVFKVVSAPPSAGDPCVPGASSDVSAIAICQAPGSVPAGTLAQFTIPAGTPVGTLCSGTIPCRPNAFVGLAAVSGTVASVRAILLRQFPMGGSFGGLSPAGNVTGNNGTEPGGF
jgi:hypothetical protein